MPPFCFGKTTAGVDIILDMANAEGVNQQIDQIERDLADGLLEPEDAKSELTSLIRGDIRSLPDTERAVVVPRAMALKQKIDALMLGQQKQPEQAQAEQTPPQQAPEQQAQQIDQAIQAAEDLITKLGPDLAQATFDPDQPNYDGTDTPVQFFDRVKLNLGVALKLLEKIGGFEELAKVEKIKKDLLIRLESTEKALHKKVFDKWKTTVETNHHIFATLRTTTAQVLAEVPKPAPNFGLIATAETQLQQAMGECNINFTGLFKTHLETTYLNPAQTAIDQLKAKQTEENEKARLRVECDAWWRKPEINRLAVALQAVLDNAYANADNAKLTAMNYLAAVNARTAIQTAETAASTTLSTPFPDAAKPNPAIERLRSNFPNWIRISTEALTRRADEAGFAEWNARPEIVALETEITRVNAIDINTQVQPNCVVGGPCYDLVALTTGVPGFENRLNATKTAAANANLLNKTGVFRLSERTKTAIQELSDRLMATESHLTKCKEAFKPAKTLEMNYHIFPWTPQEIESMGALTMVHSYSPSVAINRLITSDFAQVDPMHKETAYKSRVLTYIEAGGAWREMGEALGLVVMAHVQGMLDKATTFNPDYLTQRKEWMANPLGTNPVRDFDAVKRTSVYVNAVEKVVFRALKKMLTENRWNGGVGWSNGTSLITECLDELIGIDPSKRDPALVAYIDSFREIDPISGLEIQRKFKGLDNHRAEVDVQTTAIQDLKDFIKELASYMASSMDLRKMANTMLMGCEEASYKFVGGAGGSETRAAGLIYQQAYQVEKKADQGEFATRTMIMDLSSLQPGEIPASALHMIDERKTTTLEYLHLLFYNDNIKNLCQNVSWKPMSTSALLPLSEWYFLTTPEQNGVVGSDRIGDDNHQNLINTIANLTELFNMVGSCWKDDLSKEMATKTAEELSNFVSAKMSRLTSLGGLIISYAQALPWSLEVPRVKKDATGKHFDMVRISPRAELFEALRSAMSIYIIYLFGQIKMNFESFRDDQAYLANYKIVKKVIRDAISNYSSLGAGATQYDLTQIPPSYHPTLRRRFGFNSADPNSSRINVREELIALIDDKGLEKKPDKKIVKTFGGRTRGQHVAYSNLKAIAERSGLAGAQLEKSLARQYGSPEKMKELETHLEFPFSKPSDKDNTK